MPVVQFRTTINPDGTNTVTSYLHDPVDHTGVCDITGNDPVIIYPNPVRDVLSIRMPVSDGGDVNISHSFHKRRKCIPKQPVTMQRG